VCSPGESLSTTRSHSTRSDTRSAEAHEPQRRRGRALMRATRSAQPRTAPGRAPANSSRSAAVRCGELSCCRRRSRGACSRGVRSEPLEADDGTAGATTGTREPVKPLAAGRAPSSRGSLYYASRSRGVPSSLLDLGGGDSLVTSVARRSCHLHALRESLALVCALRRPEPEHGRAAAFHHRDLKRRTGSGDLLWWSPSGGRRQSRR
jgi:hypothetical protein